MTKINEIKALISYIKSPLIIVILGASLLFILLSIILLNKKNYQWMKKISIPTLLISLMLILVKLFGTNIIISKLNNKNETVKIILEPFTRSLLDNLFIYSLPLLLISIIMLFIYFKLRKKEK